jgi:hypothetical protein
MLVVPSGSLKLVRIAEVVDDDTPDPDNVNGCDCTGLNVSAMMFIKVIY